MRLGSECEQARKSQPPGPRSSSIRTPGTCVGCSAPDGRAIRRVGRHRSQGRDPRALGGELELQALTGEHRRPSAARERGDEVIEGRVGAVGRVVEQRELADAGLMGQRQGLVDAGVAECGGGRRFVGEELCVVDQEVDAVGQLQRRITAGSA